MPPGVGNGGEGSPMSGAPSDPGRVSLGGSVNGLGLVLGVVAPGHGTAGVKVRVKCINPGPWGVAPYPMWG